MIYDLVDDLKAAGRHVVARFARNRAWQSQSAGSVCCRQGRNAGCLIEEGMVRRGSKCVSSVTILSFMKVSCLLCRFKDEVKEVPSGQECGMAFENYGDLKANDIIECYEVEEVARTLDD